MNIKIEVYVRIRNRRPWDNDLIMYDIIKDDPETISNFVLNIHTKDDFEVSDFENFINGKTNTLNHLPFKDGHEEWFTIVTKEEVLEDARKNYETDIKEIEALFTL